MLDSSCLSHPPSLSLTVHLRFASFLSLARKPVYTTYFQHGGEFKQWMMMMSVGYMLDPTKVVA